MKKSHILFLTAVTLGFAPGLRAATIFSDNFDGSPYTTGAALVTGTGNLAHGYWGTNNSFGGTTITSGTTYVSSPRSLELNVSGSGQAQVIGTFSEDGTTATNVIDPYSLEFSFMMKTSTLWATFYIYGNDAQPVLIAFQGSDVRAYHSSSSLIYSSIAIDTWYTMKINVAAPGTGTYSVGIYDTGNTLLGSSSGAYYGSVTNSQFFTLYTSDTNGQFYIDNVSAISVPEPGTFTLLLLTAAGFGLKRRRRSH